MTSFITPEESHKHSLQTLDVLYEYDDFMESIDSVVDLGCGTGLDLEWWATRTTRDDNPQPLNITCVGVDTVNELNINSKYPNITFQQTNFEKAVHPHRNGNYDILWSHDSFQYALNPLDTLAKWYECANDGAMLVIIIPQTTNIHHHKLAFTQESYSYYHHTLVSLIHMLAVSGWDCKNGFFLKKPQDPWIHAIVYKSQHKPMDPSTTSWYDLMKKNLLPESADKSVFAHGYLRQQDLTVPWLDHSLSWMGQQ